MARSGPRNRAAGLALRFWTFSKSGIDMARKLKIKLPKRIAGIKIPKKVRKGPIAQVLNSKAGQVVLAEALLAAAGVVGAKTAAEDPERGERQEGGTGVVESTKRAARSVLGGVQAEGEEGKEQLERVGHALKEAARAFRDALNGPTAPAPRETKDESRPAEKKGAPIGGRLGSH